MKICHFSFLFLTPNFHKVPIKYRFFYSNINSIGNNFNGKFENLLKKSLNMLKHIYKDIFCFCNISNSFEIVNKLKSNSIYSIKIYDFENLFNTMFINSLKDPH